MTKNAAIVTTVVAALQSWPAAVQAENQIDLQNVADVFIRILTNTESEFDCLFRIESVKHIPATSESASKYYAEYRAAGTECEKAGATLDIRGKKESIVFYWLDTYKPPSDARGERILDLLHRIDPPVK